MALSVEAEAVRPSTRADALLFLGIAAVALLLRFVHLLEARSVPIFDAVFMDGRSYSAWADRIAAGDWIGDKVFYQAPLYPYFLAVLKLLVGDDLWRIRLVQIAIGSIACGILFLAGRAFFSRTTGVVAGLLLAIYPPAIFFDGLIQKANLGLLWTVLLLLALARARARPGWRTFALAGIPLGLLMLTREETILLVPVLGAWSVLATPGTSVARRARSTLGFAAGLALVLLPVLVRNAAVGGEFALTTSQAGSNFYIGNNPSANGTYVPLVPGRQNTEFERKDAFDLAERESGRKLSPGEVSRFWFAKSFAWIRANPGDWARLLGTKLALLVNGYEMPDYEDQYFYEESCRLLRALDAFWNYGVLFPLAMVGLVLSFPRRREILVLHLVLATLAAGVVLFYVFARYRYPIVPVLVLFAAAALVRGTALARGRRFGDLGLAGIVAVLRGRRLELEDPRQGRAASGLPQPRRIARGGEERRRARDRVLPPLPRDPARRAGGPRQPRERVDARARAIPRGSRPTARPPSCARTAGALGCGSAPRSSRRGGSTRRALRRPRARPRREEHARFRERPRQEDRRSRSRGARPPRRRAGGDGPLRGRRRDRDPRAGGDPPAGEGSAGREDPRAPRRV
jgi:4-amino-4-deoxy-L-arabinose transferase-like glycosyltransferase